MTSIFNKVLESTLWRGKVNKYGLYGWKNYCCEPVVKNLNPMRTTCWLVKMNILAFIEPIREGVSSK